MFTNIISAIGNNNSVYPLLLRDCGIENVAKGILTYKQNAKESKVIAKHALRERLIDDYGTSAIWLGGIPFFGKICDFFIKKAGFSPNVNTKLFKETAEQGLEYNIKKFKNSAPKAVENLIKVANNRDKFKKLAGVKFLITTSVPILLMGYVLPKLNFWYTKKQREKELSLKTNSSKNLMRDFEDFKKKRDNTSFKGISALADLSTLQKMMILDGGLTAGRVYTGRGWGEKGELGFKMAGMYYLNFYAPKNIDKMLNKLTKKIFKINIDLDPKILADKKFIKNINNLELPDKNLLNYIDNNPKSMFSELAKKTGLIETLPGGIRNPERYVDLEKLKDFRNSLFEFANSLKKSVNPEKLARKAFMAKSFNIITNILVSSFLLAVALPKAQFIFRKMITGSDLEPGIK